MLISISEFYCQSEPVWTLTARGQWYLPLASAYCSTTQEMWPLFLHNMWKVLTHSLVFIWQMLFCCGLFHDFIHSAWNHMLNLWLRFLVSSGVFLFPPLFLGAVCSSGKLMLRYTCGKAILPVCCFIFLLTSLLVSFLCLGCSYDA